ncbi:MAG: response regulator, partial [Deltaproteobacteria bacterium]|nr:response regulator [Deltaproteobacteria bacterium]
MRKKILLAEDSVTIQKVFELAFEKSGFSVVAVDNGDEVVRVAEEISPDLVVVDVTLPGKDGFEVASAILAGENTKNFPVLILSGTLNPLDEEKLKACGAKGVLFKPFETMELLEKVGGLIGKREEAPPPVAVEPVEPPPPA